MLMFKVVLADGAPSSAAGDHMGYGSERPQPPELRGLGQSFQHWAIFAIFQ